MADRIAQLPVPEKTSVIDSITTQAFTVQDLEIIKLHLNADQQAVFQQKTQQCKHRALLQQIISTYPDWREVFNCSATLPLDEIPFGTVVYLSASMIEVTPDRKMWVNKSHQYNPAASGHYTVLMSKTYDGYEVNIDNLTTTGAQCCSYSDSLDDEGNYIQIVWPELLPSDTYKNSEVRTAQATATAPTATHAQAEAPIDRNLTRASLRTRYEAGVRDFQYAQLNTQSIADLELTNINLTHADLSRVTANDQTILAGCKINRATLNNSSGASTNYITHLERHAAQHPGNASDLTLSAHVFL